MIWLIAIPTGVLVIYLFTGAIRAHLRWEDEKELHRCHGGDAPPETEIRKLP